MKIMLHGATNGSNFGDCLFVHLFWEKLKTCDPNGDHIFFEVPLFGISEFCRHDLGYFRKQRLSDLFTAELLVYISGGYFGDRKRSFYESLIRFFRYMPIGLLFLLRRKPIAIFGIGGGPIYNKALRKIMCTLIDNAIVVTVRDEETASYFKEYGVKRDIIVNSDTAHSISLERIPKLDDKVSKDIEVLFKGKKILFLHIYGSPEADHILACSISEPLNDFLEEHDEYGVIIGRDFKSPKPLNESPLTRSIKCDRIYYYDYTGPWQLCSLLNQCDVIVTPKLHVGIIGATLSKSVLSFPIHKEKTYRYYRQIGHVERCIPLEEASYDNVLGALNKYHDKGIVISDELKRLGKRNLDIMEECVYKLAISKGS